MSSIISADEWVSVWFSASTIYRCFIGMCIGTKHVFEFIMHGQANVYIYLHHKSICTRLNWWNVKVSGHELRMPKLQAINGSQRGIKKNRCWFVFIPFVFGWRWFLYWNENLVGFSLTLSLSNNMCTKMLFIRMCSKAIYVIL